MPTLRYLHLDVFTSTRLEGNQLAVFPDPPALDPDLMQRIAAEMAFSESTFIYPPSSDGDARMRIFTPAEELPMAGHPTIGSTFALAADGRIPRGQERFVFELGVGPIEVSLEWGADGLSFAWMTQLLPAFGPKLPNRDDARAPRSASRPRISTAIIRPKSCRAACRSCSCRCARAPRSTPWRSIAAR